MKISGFSYVRNGFDYGIPFLESFQSILPICDELVVAVGDSTDGTKEAIIALNNSKIKIIDTIWDEKLRSGGKVFAQQSNIALDNISGDWAFHIQADEVIHEDDLPVIKKAILDNNSNKMIDGFILPFFHFWGSYQYIRTSRSVHRHEIRLFRNDKLIRSYRDSQGFRSYESIEGYESGIESGYKLKVKKINAFIYHYNNVRHPKLAERKHQKMGFFYHKHIVIDDEKLKEYNYNNIDRLSFFNGKHPALMLDKVNGQDWEFTFNPKKAVWKTKDWIMQPIEDFLGFRIGEYRNYILVN